MVICVKISEAHVFFFIIANQAYMYIYICLECGETCQAYVTEKSRNDEKVICWMAYSSMWQIYCIRTQHAQTPNI